MSEPVLIPERSTTAAAGDERKPFDLKAHARKLKETPKEHYQEAVEPELPPPPKNDPPPPGPDNPPPGGTAPDGEGEPTQQHRDTAKTVFDMVDTITAKVCEGMVGNPQRYPADHFRFDPHTRAQAEYQLAKGIAQGGGKFKMPWWAALAGLMAFQGFLTWQKVKQAREQEEEQSPKQQEPHRTASDAGHRDQPSRPAQMRAVHPDSITDRNGRTVPVKPPAKAKGPMPPCQHCGTPVKHRGRRYCSQSCAGKATSAKRRQKQQPAATAPTEAIVNP